MKVLIEKLNTLEQRKNSFVEKHETEINAIKTVITVATIIMAVMVASQPIACVVH